MERLVGSELQAVGETLEAVNGDILKMADALHGKAQHFRMAAQRLAAVGRGDEAGRDAAIGRIAVAFADAARHCAMAADVLVGASREGQAYVRRTVALGGSAVGGAMAGGGSPSPATVGVLGGAAVGGAGAGFGTGNDAGAGEAAAPAWMAGGGLADVDVVAADYADNPIAGAWARGGLTKDDYRWAVAAWDREVRPGLDLGMTRDDFVSVDVARGAQPTRRYQDVYDMFLGSDPIVIDRMPDGQLRVGSGRHRIEIARELGIARLPAKWR